MESFFSTKINFANYKLKETSSAISVPNYMKKPKRPAQSDADKSGTQKEGEESA